MKKLVSLIAAAIIGCAAVSAQTPWLPPVFVETEWSYVGDGCVMPGVFDYFPNEYPEMIETSVYSSNVTPGDFWITPHTEALNIEEYLFPGPFIVHTQNPEKVWTDPVWAQHPMIFCFYHIVPEVYGMMGSDSNYGKLQEDGVISFPPNSYKWETNPTAKPYSNLNGTFEIILPDLDGIIDMTVDADAPVYYNLQGLEVANPDHGIYIVRQGSTTKKIRK